MGGGILGAKGDSRRVRARGPVLSPDPGPRVPQSPPLIRNSQLEGGTPLLAGSSASALGLQRLVRPLDDHQLRLDGVLHDPGCFTTRSGPRTPPPAPDQNSTPIATPHPPVRSPHQFPDQGGAIGARGGWNLGRGRVPGPERVVKHPGRREFRPPSPPRRAAIAPPSPSSRGNSTEGGQERQLQPPQPPPPSRRAERGGPRGARPGPAPDPGRPGPAPAPAPSPARRGSGAPRARAPAGRLPSQGGREPGRSQGGWAAASELEVRPSASGGPPPAGLPWPGTPSAPPPSRPPWLPTLCATGSRHSRAVQSSLQLTARLPSRETGGRAHLVHTPAGGRLLVRPAHFYRRDDPYSPPCCDATRSAPLLPPRPPAPARRGSGWRVGCGPSARRRRGRSVAVGRGREAGDAPTAGARFACPRRPQRAS